MQCIVEMSMQYTILKKIIALCTRILEFLELYDIKRATLNKMLLNIKFYWNSSFIMQISFIERIYCTKYVLHSAVSIAN